MSNIKLICVTLLMVIAFFVVTAYGVIQENKTEVGCEQKTSST